MLFWGLVSIPNWYMDCVLTNAQYELLMCDAPIIVYSKDKEGKDRKHTRKEMDDLVKRWNEKKKREEETGTRVNLNDFLRRGEDAITEANSK